MFDNLLDFLTKPNDTILGVLIFYLFIFYLQKIGKFVWNYKSTIYKTKLVKHNDDYNIIKVKRELFGIKGLFWAIYTEPIMVDRYCLKNEIIHIPQTLPIIKNCDKYLESLIYKTIKQF